MGTRSAFSVTKALSAAVNFVPKALGGAWLVLAFLLIATLGGHHLVMHFHAHRPIGMIAVAVLYPLKIIALGALYRLALFGTKARDEGLGFGGIQIGWPEVRLFVANIVVALFMVTIAIAVFIVFAVAFETSGLANGYANTREAVAAMVCRHATVADGVVIAALVGAAVLLVFVALKLSLVHAATVAQRHLVTLNAMGLSAGNVGKLLIGMVILVLPFAVVCALLLHLFGVPVGQVNLLPHVWGNRQAYRGVHILMMLLNVGLLLPLLVGFFASAYRQITENRAR